MPTTYELLKQAIVEKKQVVATYDGLRREMCPHQLGTNKGRVYCLFYQFAGDSGSRPVVDGALNSWRCMEVDRLVDVSLRDGEWHTAPNFANPANCLDTIDVEVNS